MCIKQNHRAPRMNKSISLSSVNYFDPLYNLKIYQMILIINLILELYLIEKIDLDLDLYLNLEPDYLRQHHDPHDLVVDLHPQLKELVSHLLQLNKV